MQTVFGKQFLEKEEEKVLDDSNYTFINQVKEFILKNIDKENLTIDEIASELYMSRTAFFNKWKALTGESTEVFYLSYSYGKHVSYWRVENTLSRLFLK